MAKKIKEIYKFKSIKQGITSKTLNVINDGDMIYLEFVCDECGEITLNSSEFGQCFKCEGKDKYEKLIDEKGPV